MMNPDLERIFACDDQSALIHNYVANEDPPPGAWSYHSTPQSPLGRVSFPEVIILPQGQVITRGRGEGRIIENILTEHRWLPWLYTGTGGDIQVQRAVTKDTWVAKIRTRKKQSGLLLMECKRATGLDVSFERIPEGLCFRWRDRFDIYLTFGPAVEWLVLSDDRGSLSRKFAGFDDVQLSDTHCQWCWQGGSGIWIGAAFAGSLEVQFSVVKAGDPRPEGVPVKKARKAERKRWEDFFRDRVPALRTEDPIVRDAYYFAWQTLWSNRCEGGSGLLGKSFISPSRLNYGSQWWWDEAFHTAVIRHLQDAGDAYETFENFWKLQREDGGIPGSVRFGQTRQDQPMEELGYVGMAMQPPVLALVLQLLKETPGWPRDVRPLYEPLLRLAQWHLNPQRDTDQDGLIEYHHSFDTTGDQTQRWDTQLHEPAKQIGPMRPTESVDANVWMSLLWENLGEMAAELGDEVAAKAHREKAHTTFDLIENLMWDEGDGFYYDIDGLTHEKIRVKTPYGFMPMLSRLARPERVQRLVNEHLKNPAEFWSEYPLPSVSLDHPLFDPRDMWRGPTWVNVNWLVVEGLARQGYQSEAVELARKTVVLVGPRYQGSKRIRSPRIWEWFHPHTGAELGNNQYSWTALVVDLILRFLTP